MIYSEYTIGGELYHSVTGKAYKYIDKVRTKSGKWRYIYDKGNKSGDKKYVPKYKSMNEVGDANNRRKLREMSDEDLVNEINKLEEAKRFYTDEEGRMHVARKDDKYAKQVFREGFYRELGDYLEDKQEKRKNHRG